MDGVEDRISKLPDDILVNLLSPMGLKEAAKTSIISERWRYLWAKRTHLDFNHLTVLPELDPYVEKCFPSEEEESKYVNWVNQVVGVHCGPCIDAFKVSFHVDKKDAHHVDRWVRFAISKKGKDLVLNLIAFDTVYTIGFDILKPSLAPGDSGISFLKSMHLTYINISGEFLEFLLSQCRLLERLDVRYSRTLVGLKVMNQSCKLKQLAIHTCPNLEELEIDAANLVYFDFISANKTSKLLFKSAPVLVEVRAGGCFEPNSILPPIFQLASQLSKLSLELLPNQIPVPLPTFRYLKQLNLVLNFQVDMDIDLVPITTLLEACPAVCEFKLEISWFSEFLRHESLELVDRIWDDEDGDGDADGDVEGENVVVDNMVAQVERKTHPNLKLLHVVGFNGGAHDVYLILDLVDFACNLETIICDSRRVGDGDEDDIPDAGVIEAIEAASRSRAAKLTKIVPPKIRIEII